MTKYCTRKSFYYTLLVTIYERRQVAFSFNSPCPHHHPTQKSLWQEGEKLDIQSWCPLYPAWLIKTYVWNSAAGGPTLVDLACWPGGVADLRWLTCSGCPAVRSRPWLAWSDLSDWIAWLAESRRRKGWPIANWAMLLHRVLGSEPPGRPYDDIDIVVFLRWASRWLTWTCFNVKKDILD